MGLSPTYPLFSPPWKRKGTEQRRCSSPQMERQAEGLEENRRKKSYLSWSTPCFLRTGHRERKILPPTAAVMSYSKGVSDGTISLSGRVFILEARITLPTYMLLICIIFHPETRHVPEHW